MSNLTDAFVTPTVPTSYGTTECAFRMRAYYYEFDMTGVLPVDVILSAVACAGKAFHHTDSWQEECSPYHDRLRGESPIAWIQNAANDAAAAIRPALIAPAVGVTDAEVEAAAKALYLHDDCHHAALCESWETLPDYGRDRYRDKARAALLAFLKTRSTK